MRNLNNPKVPLKVQPRSGFDKSHFHLFTATVGNIVPILIDEVIGNSKVNLRVNIAASMPPLAADTFMKTDLCVEAFFVPLRLCSASFEPWFCQRSDPAVGNAGVSDWPAFLPIGQVDLSLHPGTGDSQPALDTLFGHRGLAEYLGWRASALGAAIFNFNLMPFIAYHLCWDWYYRNNNVQKSCFAEVDSTFDINDSDQMYVAAVLPHLFNRHQPVIGSTLNNDKQWNFWLLADNISLFSLRKRNFDFDYFTNALPQVSLGGNQEVMISPGGTDGKFSIAALRAANSLQIFNERNMLSSPRYIDTLKQRFGGHPSAGVAQMPILLGSARYNVYTKGSVISANNINNYGPPSATNRNPFSYIAGGVQGNAYASGSDFIIDNFIADEPGYIIVNASLVPTVTYSNGCDRLFTRYRDQSITDMATHALQNVGNQPIYQYELTGKIGTTDVSQPVFGYTDRYSDFMIMNDRISGLFQKGMALDMFVSQRYITYSDSPTISDSFLKIPSDYLDSVLINAYSPGDTSLKFGYWAQVGFDYKVSMPLAEYSIPSLQDPAYEHGETITIHRGGFRL